MAERKLITQEDILKALDAVYARSINGIPKVSKPIAELSEDYLKRNPDVQTAAKKMLNAQIAKCTTSGFITGFGRLITLPVSIPANVGSVMYVQMRMIAACAYMGGFNVNEDQVQTFIYACLAGVSINEILKKLGVNFGKKMAEVGLKKLPGKILVKINQKVGFRFLTKFGEKGMVNLVKAVPVVGAVINGGLDYAETKIIANRAFKMFIKKDFSDDSDKDENIIDVDELDLSYLDEDLEKEQSENERASEE